MTHALPRALFGLALVVAGAVFTVVIVATLDPKPVALVQQNDVAIASLAKLKDQVPQLVLAPYLQDLEAKARHARSWTYGRNPVPKALPVYIVKNGDQVRGFIAFDPRNGCDLEVLAPSIQASYHAVFHDVCHGSLYDMSGAHVGGPSPFTLDELVLDVRGDTIYASTREVKPGRYIYPR